VPRAASSTAAALKSVSRLSVASQEHFVVAAAVAGPAVVGVGVPVTRRLRVSLGTAIALL